MWILVIIVAIFIYFGIQEWLSERENRKKEDERYLQILRSSIHKVDGIDISYYKDKIQQAKPQIKKLRDKHLIALLDTQGNSVNICKKCGSSMRIVRARKTFLGCSRYPHCVSYGKMSSIMEIPFFKNV